MKSCTALVVLSLVLTACSPSSANTLRSMEFTWQPFEWKPLESGGGIYDKAFLMVPIQFAGLESKCWLQLDTAAYSLIDGRALDTMGIRYKVDLQGAGYRVAQFDATIAGYEARKASFRRLDQQASVFSADSPIGTLGMDFFHDKILVIDFPNRRLGIARSEGQIPAVISNRVVFTSAEMLQHWFLVKVTEGERTLKVAYDTGSSLFPFIVDKDLWEGLTGKVGDAPENTRVEGESWGKTVTIVGAPTEEEIRIGGISLGRPHVYFDTTSSITFGRSGVDGVMGNALFYDRYIVILDCIGQRFGLVDTQNP